MDGLHATMAAEAGLQMALREVSTLSDEDKDGGSGTIGASTPLPIKGSTAQVTKSTDGPIITLTSTGRRGTATKQLRATVTSGTAAGMPTIYWSHNNSKRVSFATATGTVWTSGSNSASISEEPLWVVSASSRIRNETVIASLDKKKDVKVNVRYNGLWASWQTVCTDTASSSRRMIDVAYEQNSGDGLLCYFKNSGNVIAYHTITSGAISAQSSLSLPSTDDVRWISLVSNPASDEITIATLNKDKEIRAAVWNGSSFGSWTTLESNADTEADQCYSVAYETVSGRVMVVWAKKDADFPYYSIRTGSSWSAAAAMGTVEGDQQWIRLASDPTSNALLMCTYTADKEVWASRWSGTAWDTPIQLSTDTGKSDGNSCDVAFEGTGTRGMVMYRKNGTNAIKYKIWNGSSWGTETTAFTPSSALDYIELSNRPGSPEIYAAVRADKALDVIVWSGSAMGTKVTMSSDLASSKAEKSYDLDVGAAEATSGGVTISAVEIP